MMSIWHLLWIIPLAGSLGFVTAAMMVAAGENPSAPCGSREDGGEDG